MTGSAALTEHTLGETETHPSPDLKLVNRAACRSADPTGRDESGDGVPERDSKSERRAAATPTARAAESTHTAG